MLRRSSVSHAANNNVLTSDAVSTGQIDEAARTHVHSTRCTDRNK